MWLSLELDLEILLQNLCAYLLMPYAELNGWS